ncbi:hypothetical protein CONCODRAFT_80826 [Conidiobolus coronatus NRRL 28638]|uniref:Uncharacterized protein n=1 Tax=Conidiobolus coronatus (strain ATCC 28846 / CBS 209.66 / NRRL 28638) TaxID=796925 RepID=A0A137NR78_CONC2|nr:hypothetical protein CONCODRAFT_80826 [Conidiobolus coronatus NRRL 28638]|eukprot:KXN65245.1 hypothetical protein CONCODRAFT_80826 [Conidiobolus coronatus NRRL 28638]
MPPPIQLYAISITRMTAQNTAFIFFLYTIIKHLIRPSILTISIELIVDPNIIVPVTLQNMKS